MPNQTTIKSRDAARAERVATMATNVREYFAAIGAKGGHAGAGKTVDPEMMRKAARARWAKARGKK